MFTREKQMQDDEAEGVNEQVSDAISATNTSTLGLNPALSLDQTILAQSQAQGVLFANMLSEQQRLVNLGNTYAIKNAAEMFGLSDIDGATATDSTTTSTKSSS